MYKNIKIEYFDVIDSTNDYLKKNIKKNIITTDTLIISKKQTKGRGTNGRKFISDENGIYFSLCIFNKYIKNITPKIAVAIYYTFKKFFSIELKIKWINDLYFNNKKVVGILCEKLDNDIYIIGIGVDLYKNNNLSDDLKNIVGYIFDKKIDEINLVNQIIKNIYKYIDKPLDQIYINKNIIINKNFLYKNKKYIAVGIDDNCNLIAKDENCECKIFISTKDIIFDK